jgi:hypothetical protein
MHKVLIFLLIVLLSLLPLAIAETGCFTYKDSPFFCSDISREQAESECQLYGCNLAQSFYPERSCSEPEMLQNCEFSTVIDVPEELPVIPELIEETPIKEEKTNYVLIIGLLIFSISIFVIYTIYKQNPQFINQLFSKKQQQNAPLNVIVKTPGWLTPKENSRLKEKKIRWQKKHRHKMNKFQRDEMLQEFGPKYEPSVTKEFRKLKGLVRTYKRRKKQTHKSNPEEHFKKLEQLGKKIKEKEQLIIQTHAQVDPNIIKKHEVDNLMKDLKDISSGKY